MKRYGKLAANSLTMIEVAAVRLRLRVEESVT